MDEADLILKAARPGAAAPAVETGERDPGGAAAVRCRAVHIIDGGVEEGLLAEVFSNEGIGTLVHANEYQAIRRAQRKPDLPACLLSVDSGRRRERRGW